MSINPINQGNPTYDTALTVSPSADVDVIKLRSRESAPLSHESLDENFVNLANKINEILGLKIDEISITDNAGNWEIDVGSLGISAGSHISITATGQISHSAREASDIGWSTVDLSPSPRVFVDGLDFDDYGHVKGYKASTLNFSGTGSVSVDQTTNNNQIVISSASYVSGDSPSFGSITATGDIDIDGQYLQNGSPIGGGNVMYFVNGRVGINKTSPGYTLHVERSSSETQNYTSLKVGTSVTSNHNYAWLGLEADAGITQIFTGASNYTSYGGPGATNIYNNTASIYIHPEGNSNSYKLQPDNFELNLNGVGPGIKINSKTGNPYLGFLSAGAQQSYMQHAVGDALYVGSVDDITIRSTGTTNTAKFNASGLYLLAPSATNSSTVASPLSIANAKNTVSMFLGMNQSTSDWGANDYSGSIRWNGSGQAWGDLTYYPRFSASAGDSGAGQFRFSTAGSTVSTTPNAKVGVGSLYSASEISIGDTNPDGYGLRVCNKNAQIFNSIPVLHLKDKDHLESAVDFAGYISFRDTANTQAGFMGYGSSSNHELFLWNGSSAATAHTRIKSLTGGIILDGLNGVAVQNQSNANGIVFTPSTTTGGLNQITTGVAGQALQIATTGGDGVLTEGIKIQPTGEVRNPANPHVSGRRLSASFITTSYLNAWDLYANTGNHYDNSTGSFTAPLYGKYLVTITGLLSSPSVSNNSNLWLQRNGVTTYFMGCYGQMTGNYLGFGGSHTVLLNSNDTLRFLYNHSAGGGLHNSYLNFSIVYLG